MGKSWYNLDSRKEALISLYKNITFYQDKNKRWMYQLECSTCKKIVKKRIGDQPYYYYYYYGIGLVIKKVFCYRCHKEFYNNLRADRV